jgi:pyridoxamine 5'-phosphate oxidase
VQSQLTEDRIDPDPIRQFGAWFADAAELPDSNAMALATSTRDGRPSARMVLLKGFDDRGFTFFTNYESRKADELRENPRAALVFFWQQLHRQIRIEGSVERTSGEESDAYFATRARGSQVAARASDQSRPLSGREELERRVELVETAFAHRPVERPECWGGYRLVPNSIEFWQGQANRLHDRLRYTRMEVGGAWTTERLAP